MNSFPRYPPAPRRLLALLVCVTIGLVACSTSSQTGSPSRNVSALLTPAPAPAGAIENQVPPVKPSAANGAQIYARKCVACHGEQALGNGPRAATVKQQGGQVARLLEPTLYQSAIPAAWFDVVSNGRLERLMPGFAQSLTPVERWDVLSYVWALGVTPQILQTGKDLYSTQCAACHGATGKGDGPQAKGAKMSDLSGPSYLAAHSLMDVSNAMVKGTAHQTVTLTETQRRVVADYVRTLGYGYTETSRLQQNALQGGGVITFDVANQTPGGAVVQASPVTLHAYDTTGEVFSRTAQVNQTGVATFAQLPHEDGYFYQAEITYNGAKFYAAPQQFSHTLALSATLPVFEVTTDPGVISISEYHYFVQDYNEGTLTVVEFTLYDNNSDRAYIDKTSSAELYRSLKVTLPPDAMNVRFDGPGLGARFTRDGNVLYDSDAVTPGAHATTIAMIYDIPYRGSKRIERTVLYPVNTWDVFLPDNALHVVGSGLTDKGLQALQNGSVRMYTPDQPKLAADGKIVFDITGQPRSVAVPGEDGRAIGFGLIALALAAGLGYFMVMRTRRLRSADVQMALDRQALLQQVADLDTQFATGALNEPEHRQKRRTLVQQLRDIWE
jgi:mono/diheme cytochrome c family protein